MKPGFPPVLVQWRPGEPFRQPPLPAWAREEGGCSGCPDPQCEGCPHNPNPAPRRRWVQLGVWERELASLSTRLTSGASLQELRVAARELLDLAKAAGRVIPDLGREQRWELGWARSRALRALNELSAALACAEELQQDSRLLASRRTLLEQCRDAALRLAREVLGQGFGAPLRVSPRFAVSYLERLRGASL